MYCYPYKIDVNSDMIVGKSIVFLDEVSSTNDEAKKLAMKGEPDGSVIFALNQTHGKGRLGRVWNSEAGKGIYMSIILRPERALKPEYASSITLVMGLACAKAFETAGDFGKVCIKWPNDILINSKKVCGILAESYIEEKTVKYIAVGIGVNVNNDLAGFPDEVLEKATSLSLESGKEADDANVASAMLKEIDIQYKAFMNGELRSIISEYKDKCINLHSRVRANVNGTIIEGVASDITNEGNLVINTDSGEKRMIYSGEATVRDADGQYI